MSEGFVGVLGDFWGGFSACRIGTDGFIVYSVVWVHVLFWVLFGVCLIVRVYWGVLVSEGFWVREVLGVRVSW